jgi:hypothetical protein
MHQMTLNDFRRMALSLPGAEELNGLGYPNFRTGRKSFATIEGSMAVIRLTRDQQVALVAAAPEVFAPVSSGWGRLGSTVIRLDVADGATVQDALALAWRNVAEAPDVAKSAEATNVVDAASVLDVTDSAEAADVINVVDEVRVVNVEPYDDLKSVIERLQVCWGTGWGEAHG